MKKTITLALLASMFFTVSANAAWLESKSVSQITDEVTLYASVSSKGARFFMYDGASGKIIGGLIAKRFNQIHYDPKRIIIRIDKNDTHYIEYDSWEPRQIYFDITSDIIDEMMAGKKMIISYPKSSLSSKIESFDLKKSSKIIRKTIKNYASLEVRQARERERQARKREQQKAEELFRFKNRTPEEVEEDNIDEYEGC